MASDASLRAINLHDSVSAPGGADRLLPVQEETGELGAELLTLHFVEDERLGIHFQWSPQPDPVYGGALLHGDEHLEVRALAKALGRSGVLTL